jgi:hypothetical protein
MFKVDSTYRTIILYKNGRRKYFIKMYPALQVLYLKALLHPVVRVKDRADSEFLSVVALSEGEILIGGEVCRTYLMNESVLL